MGIEQGVDQALEFYQNSFPILTDEHINEMIKLEAMIPKAAGLLPTGGRFEVPIGNADFIGFIDYLVPAKGPSWGDPLNGADPTDSFFDLYDFKYSSNSKSYLESGQLHEYKYWYELTHPGCRIRNLYFLFVPKVKIRQKKTETLIQFRERLREALEDATPWVEPVSYNPLKVVDFLTSAKRMIETTDFALNPNHLCGWCEYEEYCQKGWDYMILPKNERRKATGQEKKVIWIYGAPFSGKTTFANAFPDPLMLNTDGNVKVVSGIDAPVIPIKDEVTVEGRLTKRKLAYEVFLDAVAELEKKQNDFKTIVVDLLEDVYEGCRVFICDRQGWKHESDDSFRAWDMVRSEFLNTLKRLVNLDYENIILISHEDRTRDLTRKGGDKISSIKPNLQDKVANKVAGMVDLVARIVAEDGDRVLSFKTSEVIFGGGRLTVHNKEIPLDYAAFCEVYEEANQKATSKAAERAGTGGNVITPPAAETADSAQQTGRRRTRQQANDPNADAGFTTPAPESAEGGNVPPVNTTEDASPSDHAPQTGHKRSRKSKEEQPPEEVEDCPSNISQPVTETAPDASPSDPTKLPYCPDADRIFRQFKDSKGEIPLCPSIDAAHRCHKDGGPDKCPLWDRPKEEAPMMDVNPPKGDQEPEAAPATPPKRTRKKRGET